MRNKRIILVLSFLFFFSQYIYIPFQIAYLTELGVTAAFAGIVTGAYGGAQLLLRLPLGVMADRAGKHKKIIITGIVFAGLACMLRVLCPGAAGFLAASTLSGIGSATWISFMVMNSGLYEKDEQQEASGKIVFAYNAGILAAFVTGTLLYDRGGMKLICSLGMAASIPGLFLSLGLTEKDQKKAVLPVRELLNICKNRNLIFISLLALVQQGIQMGTTMSFTTQVLRELGAGKQLLGLASIIYMVFSVASSYYASLEHSRKKSSSFWICLIFAGVILYCVSVPRVQSVGIIMMLQMIPGWASGFLFSTLTAEAMAEVPPKKRSTAMGFFQAVYAFGMMFFPMMIGWIQEAAGMVTAYDVLGVCAGGCVLAVWRRSRVRGA